MVARTIALRIVHYQPNRPLVVGAVDRVDTRAHRHASGGLCEDDAAVNVSRHRPCPPVELGTSWPTILGAHDEAGADRPRCEPRHLDRHRRLIMRLREPPLDHNLPHVLQDRFLESTEATGENRVVGYGPQAQGGTQLPVFGAANVGSPEGPPIIAHATQHHQPLRLRQVPFRELAVAGRQRGLAYV
jgi:hypothetical protein